MYSLSILEARSLKSRCEQGWSLLGALREGLVCVSIELLVIAGHLWCSMAYSCLSPVSASNSTWLFSFSYVSIFT